MAEEVHGQPAIWHGRASGAGGEININEFSAIIRLDGTSSNTGSSRERSADTRGDFNLELPFFGGRGGIGGPIFKRPLLRFGRP